MKSNKPIKKKKIMYYFKNNIDFKKYILYDENLYKNYIKYYKSIDKSIKIKDKVIFQIPNYPILI